MTESTVAPVDPIVTVGVDTHSDIHVAVALDRLGRRLGRRGWAQLGAPARDVATLQALHEGMYVPASFLSAQD
jgi:hypothetical protein